MQFNLQKIEECKYVLPQDSTDLFCHPSIQKIVAAFENCGFEIRIVGGAVRDVVLGKKFEDVDFATTANPEEISNVCRSEGIKCIPTGLKHGTLTAVINGTAYEITTLRTDVETDGRHAVVEFVKDWRLDAERRDLTINAMSLSNQRVLYDYFGGIEDLAHRRIRFVNDPEVRITEDYLRILRFFRFYSKIAHRPATFENFELFTLNTIKNLAPNLESITIERIWSELRQILTGPFAPSIVELMNELNVLKHCRFPHIKPVKLSLFRQFYEAAGHRDKDFQVSRVTASALLSCFFEDEKEAFEGCNKLRLSRADRDICVFIMRHRGMSSGACALLEHYQTLLVKNVSQNRFDVLRSWIVQLMLCEGASNEDIVCLTTWSVPLFPVKGTDLKNIAQKIHIKSTLDFLKEKWIESRYSTSKDDLVNLLK